MADIVNEEVLIFPFSASSVFSRAVQENNDEWING